MTRRRCKKCGLYLFPLVTTQDHYETCGGITDDEAELMSGEDIANMVRVVRTKNPVGRVRKRRGRDEIYL